VIWVYAICERPDIPPPAGTGLDGAPLASVQESDLLAVVSHHAGRPRLRAEQALWAHERVVERLMAQRAVLPMRFGSRLPDVAALRRALASREYELLTALDGVRGRVELAVRAIGAAVEDADAVAAAVASVATADDDTGRRYVRARLELRSRVEAVGAALHEQLATLAVAERRRLGRGPRELLRASYLVERPMVGEFRALALRLQREHPDAALLCTGPWPPYSFVDVAVSCCGDAGMGA
jgi:hypothetical protein